MSSPFEVDPMKIPLTVPLQAAPPGKVTNFDHPNMSRHHQLVAIITITLTIALVFVLTRLWTRAVLVRSFGMDDVFCVLATALTITFNVVVLQQAKYGLTRQNWDIRLRTFLQYQIRGWIEWNAIGAELYIISFAVIKLSILLLYIRIFGVTNTKTRKAVWAIFALVTAVAIAGFLGNLLLCKPVKKLFVYDIKGQCNFVAVIQLARANSIMQIVTDLCINLVPIPMVLKLKVPTLQKLGILAIMATGFFVTIISIIRLTYLYPRKTTKSSSGLDIAGQYPTTMWSILELNLALICASAPALKQFIGGTFPTIKSFSSRLTSNLTGSHSGAQKTGSTSSSSKMSWGGRKNSRWGSHSERSHGGTVTGDDGIQQDITISMDRRVKDGSYLELGPHRDGTLADPSVAYGPTSHVSTHVSGGGSEKEYHSNSSREPIVRV